MVFRSDRLMGSCWHAVWFGAQKCAQWCPFLLSYHQRTSATSYHADHAPPRAYLRLFLKSRTLPETRNTVVSGRHRPNSGSVQEVSLRYSKSLANMAIQAWLHLILLYDVHATQTVRGINLCTILNRSYVFCVTKTSHSE